MSALLKFMFDALTLRDVLLYSALLLATWLFYKAGIEPFLSPIRKVRNIQFNRKLGFCRKLVSQKLMIVILDLLTNI